MGKRIQSVFSIFHNSSAKNTKVYQHPVLRHNSFVVLLISYGNIEKTKESLRSIFEQNYRNLRVLFVNQNRTQLAPIQELIENYHQQHRVFFLKEFPGSQELQNIYNAILSCQDREIVILMKEGDFFAHDWVLSSLDQVYANPDVWLSYGRHLLIPSYSPSGEKPFTMSDIIKKKQRKRTSFDFGLKSFYAALGKKVMLQDLLVEGGFYFSIEDFVIMMPMLEMASSHIAYLSDIHYLEQSEPVLSQEKKMVQTFLKPYFLQNFKKSEPYPTLGPTLFAEEKGEMSTDLLIISQSPERLISTLQSERENLSDISKIFVVIPQKTDFFAEVEKRFPYVLFIENPEKNIRPLLHKILSRSSARFFLCTTDQYVFKKKVDLKECVPLLAETKARGFYFGLGEDVSFCLRGGFEQKLPRHILALNENVRAWECLENACGDWAFPDGFAMALYEREVLKRNIELLNFQTIEEMEKNWSLLVQERRVGLFLKQTVVGRAQDSSGFIKGK